MKKLAGMLLLMMGVTVYADSSVGCGIGQQLIPQNSLVSATFRMTLNHITSSQLFGMTSGTSGCTRHSIVKTQMAPVYYAEANWEQLQLEMAMGKGEFVETFAATFGCTENSTTHFTKQMKANYNNINFSGAHPMLNDVRQIMAKDELLKSQCPYAVI